MSNKAVELYEKRFGLNISKSIAAAEKVGGLYDNQTLNNVASINFRRYASMNIQMEESWKGFNSTIFGISLAGQNIFGKNVVNLYSVMHPWISLISFLNME